MDFIRAGKESHLPGNILAVEHIGVLPVIRLRLVEGRFRDHLRADHILLHLYLELEQKTSVEMVAAAVACGTSAYSRRGNRVYA